MGPADLEQIVASLHNYEDSMSGSGEGFHVVLIGPGDDAGITLIGDTAVVETVDVITPVVNDPFTFGAISANNSISDVYAMGGRPVTALAIAGFPSCDYETVVLKEILRGAVHTLGRAGARLIGGHSFDDPELKFGLSVTGIVDRNNILKVSGATEGDVIVLTKPLGLGILTTALKGGKLTDEAMGPAIECMLTLNDKASFMAASLGATACTDITGFGLLGHAYNMVRNSTVDFVIENSRVPVLEHVLEMLDRCMVPEGAYKNLQYAEGKVAFSSGVSDESRLLLSDPQTSGGLLFTLGEDRITAFEGSSLFFSVIGRVEKGSGSIIVK
ncbi:MAG TPA: selenide, water dikinase SelD [Dissulfurispiraceae bacterium]|nr:selenide, water dikinase SelD [Dissulfurispiraceae bacterium]